MKVITIVSKIDVLGYGWCGQKMFTTYQLTSHQLEQIKDRGNGKYTREAVSDWLDSNSGDFQSVIDFSVTIGDNELDSDWEDEENMFLYNDIMFPNYD